MGVIMGRTNMSAESINVTAYEGKFSNRAKKLVGGAAIALATAGGIGMLATEMGTAVANADPGTQVAIVVGGSGDPNGKLFENTLWQNGTLHRGEIVLDVGYAAEMGPIVGSIPTNICVDNGVNIAEADVYAHLGQNTILYGFSEGTFVTNRTATDLGNKGVHVQVVNSGDPSGAPGIMNSWEGHMAKPITDGLGIIQTPPVSGSIERLDAGDVWAATANGDLGQIINDGTHMQNHRAIGPNEVPTEAFTDGGATYLIYNGTVPVPDSGTLIPIPAHYRS